jgi:hypothetical protein
VCPSSCAIRGQFERSWFFLLALLVAPSCRTLPPDTTASPSPGAYGAAGGWAQISGMCGVDGAGLAYCWGWDAEARPVPATPVMPGQRVRFIEGTLHQGCALAGDGAAYCWGPDLLRGTRLPPVESCGGPWQRPCELVPTPISTALRFTQLSVGRDFACGVTGDGATYCWGRSDAGRLGAVSDSVCLPHGCYAPLTRIAANQRFVAVASGGGHACALDADGAAWCWGAGSQGQLGARATESCTEQALTVACSRVPLRVPGGQRIVRLAAGSMHTCGVTHAEQTLCWGSNVLGQLGTDAPMETCAAGHLGAPCSHQPLPVAGGHRFHRIGAHEQHTCALTSAGAAYCWGDGASGQLGQGVLEREWPYGRRETPQPVQGGLRFAELSVNWNVCGVSDAGAVHCWGIRSPVREIAAPVPIPPPPAPVLAEFTPRAANGAAVDRPFLTVVAADGDGIRLRGGGPARCEGHSFHAAITRQDGDLELRVIGERWLGGGCTPTAAAFAYDALLQGLERGTYRIVAVHEYSDGRGGVIRERSVAVQGVVR